MDPHSAAGRREILGLLSLGLAPEADNTIPGAAFASLFEEYDFLRVANNGPLVHPSKAVS
jgi:hypothetical protein